MVETRNQRRRRERQEANDYFFDDANWTDDGECEECQNDDQPYRVNDRCHRRRKRDDKPYNVFVPGHYRRTRL